MALHPERFHRARGARVRAERGRDPKSARYNQRSVTAAELAREYGFTDVDGTQPDAWARL